MEPKLYHSLATLARQLNPAVISPPHPAVGLQEHVPCGVLVWVLGVCTKVLMFPQQVLLPTEMSLQAKDTITFYLLNVHLC